MPEGDAVYRFAARIRDAIEGEVITAARSGGPGRTPKVDRLVGATCTSVSTHGKNLIVAFDNGLALRGHLRMYGTWEVYTHGQPWRRHPSQARLVLETRSSVLVNFSAPVIELHEERAIPSLRPIATLGPDLLADDFDPAEACRRFRDPLLAGMTIGDAIMDQQVMAGVGNIWKHETLFRTKINPWLRVRELSDAELQAIVDMARDLLRASAGLPGTLTKHGRPASYVYARGGQPCRRCFTRIRSATQGQDVRRTAWCPACQPVREAQEVQPPAPGRTRR